MENLENLSQKDIREREINEYLSTRHNAQSAYEMNQRRTYREAKFLSKMSGIGLLIGLGVNFGPQIYESIINFLK